MQNYRSARGGIYYSAWDDKNPGVYAGWYTGRRKNNIVKGALRN